MKAEIGAAAEFLSRIFLTQDNVSKEKIDEFKQHLAELLEERFRNHWHENCPTKGQAYRCIRVCPEEPLDPVLEKVCNDVGVSPDDFNVPMELTLWVDPTEVVCKFGDLKCSYHTVAKKDHNSGTLDNRADAMDIDDLIENARDLYQKKQTVIIHPVHSTEMHVQNPYTDGSSNVFTMAVRINGTMHYNMSGSPPTGYDGSPRGKGKPPHSSHHRRGAGFHYHGKGSGGKGLFVANGSSTPLSSSPHHGGFHHRGGHHHHHQQHHHGNGHHQHPHSQGGSGYQNGYTSATMNGYADENGYAGGYDQRSVSPSKMNGGGGGLPPMNGGPVPISQSSPTPEQIQQQMQHPPPLPPNMPHHLQGPFGHPPADTSTMPPPPPPPSQQPSVAQPPPPPPPSSSASIAAAVTSTSTSTSSNGSSSNSNNGGSSGGAGGNNGKANSNNHNSSSSKFQGSRGNAGGRNNANRQSSPVKEMK